MNKPIYLGLSILGIIKIVIEIALRSVTHSYLTDDNEKKYRMLKQSVKNENLNLKIINSFRRNTTWKYNKPTRKNKVDVDIRENQKEFIRDNKFIVKLQQRIRRKKDNVFTE